MKRLHWLAVVVALQALVLLGWAGYHEWNRATARTIFLETVPVDPRDLLRGDYMSLSYKISTVKRPAGPDDNAYGGRSIWVVLRTDGRFATVESTSWTQPVMERAGFITVRGHVRSGWSASGMSVDYGIDKFFVPEGQGRPKFKEMVVEATVTAQGGLGIKRLLLDGHPYPGE